MADRERVGRMIAGGAGGYLMRVIYRAEEQADKAEARGLDGVADAKRNCSDAMFEAAVLVSWVGVRVADGSLTLAMLKKMRPPKIKAKKQAEKGAA